MRILFFSLDLPILLKDSDEIVGGAAVQWSSWISGFTEEGHDFGILTYKGAIKDIGENQFDFDIIESYDTKRGVRFLRLFYYQLPILYKAAKKYNPDCIIQTSAKAHTFIIMLIAKLLNVPFIHRIASDVHVDENIGSLVNRKFDIFLYKMGLKYTDIVLAQNKYQFNKLVEKFPRKKIILLHNPYKIATVKKDILGRINRTYISWIGNFRRIKNLASLAKVAKALPDIQFRIAGKEFPELDDETRNALHDLKKLGNVQFEGYLKRNEMKKFLSQSIAILNTSYNEGFSNTFLEAWATGVPVVTTKNVNPDELINRFKLGEVAEGFDDLAEKLLNVTNLDSVQYDELAQRCFDYVSDNHNPRILVKKFVSFFNKN